jgi:hypothetical protein
LNRFFTSLFLDTDGNHNIFVIVYQDKVQYHIECC